MILLNRIGKIRGEREERGEGGREEGKEKEKGGKGREEEGGGRGEVHSIIKVRVYMCEWVSEGWVSEGG